MLLRVANFLVLMAKSVDRMAFLSYGWGQWGKSDMKMRKRPLEVNCSVPRWEVRGTSREHWWWVLQSHRSVYVLHWGGMLSHRYGLYKCFYPLIKYNEKFRIINKKIKERELQKPEDSEDSGIGSMIYTFVKINHTIHFKLVHFTVCKLYLHFKISIYEITDFNTFQ